MRVLLVEDDLALANGLLTSLRHQGFSVDHLTRGKPALEAARNKQCDIIILDLGLPDMDGLQVLKELRRHCPALPVLILTARDSTLDKISGLDAGADDYLIKPFAPEELFARLRVIERRLGTAQSAVIACGQIQMDTAAHTVSVGDDVLNLSRREYMLLKALMEQAGRVLSRDQLENRLYEWGEEIASNVVEVHIHHLRKKLPDNTIRTIRGVGYSISKT
ncbi:response regulator transcription factor [Bowmanella sp. JS7-9]|uniref:Response regulator transcription factor n=1 Tax=Pseudobowmanella zhangzhouensis TaxID=1537679 RepID=A0ABW1XKZ7_9ALTE|nr:response regulator transcription factor [Bowmanella sp. JS7-9]TBX23089.1 XRE family transcriptional regulator [Bowmanella sp. JS7-9]